MEGPVVKASQKAFETGNLALGYPRTDVFISLLTRNFTTLFAGTCTVSPVFGLRAVRAFLSEHSGVPVRRDGRDLAALTAREREVLERIARGLDNEEIAAALFMSEKTVRNHVSAIFAKLDFASRGRLIVWARDAGLGRGSG